jgi:formylglycine-generating enzyme required for sulfatase activity
MTDRGFGYLAILDVEGSGRPTSIAAYLQSARGPVQGVIWNVPLQQWTFRPSIVAKFLFDDDYDDRGPAIGRDEADALAAELGTRLPTEAELRAICADGLSRWDRKKDPDGLFID